VSTVPHCAAPFLLTGFEPDESLFHSHNAFYDYLREQNQKASLYYIGSNTLDWYVVA
jgi:ribonucleotide monophosphatase NagD (HAD superfamily)